MRLAFSLWLGARCLVPAMARCDLASCCSPEKSVKAAAALCSGRTLAAFSGGSRTQPTPHPNDTPFGSVLAAWFLLWLGATLRPAAPPKKASRPRPHFAAAAPLPLFRGAAGRSPPPTQTIPPLARCSLLGSCYGSVRKRPVLLPQTAEGEAGARPQAAIHQPPLPLFGGQAVASPLPHPAAAEGAGWCSSASGRSPACPFRRRCPCSPPRGASLLSCHSLI